MSEVQDAHENIHERKTLLAVVIRNLKGFSI
jgi:hypothetical protein